MCLLTAGVLHFIISKSKIPLLNLIYSSISSIILEKKNYANLLSLIKSKPEGT